jgi:hypothetical protein
MPIPMLTTAAAADAGSPSAQAKRIVGALLGIAAAYAITRHLPFLPSTLLSSLVLAATSTFIGRIHCPLRWWALLGSTCGAVLGTAVVLAAKFQQSDPQGDLTTRALLLGCFALAGCIAGRSLSRDAAGDSARHPRDLLRSASALTTGIFAVLVTFTFLFFGLDTARTFSSRLSTSLTILVATVTVPGWLTHLLDRPPPRLPGQRP